MNIVGKAVGADGYQQDYGSFDFCIMRCHGIIRIGRMQDGWWFVYTRCVVFVAARLQEWLGIWRGVLCRRYIARRQHNAETENNREAQHPKIISRAYAGLNARSTRCPFVNSATTSDRPRQARSFGCDQGSWANTSCCNAGARDSWGDRDPHSSNARRDRRT
jgi:hypothetical protein